MIGKTISHYKVLEKLGEGGMGVVYKAEDLTLDRHVAIKFLPPHLSGDEEARKRFVHEAKAASALNHPNIGHVYEIGQTDEGQTYIAMAHYEGETLRARLARGRMSPAEALDITGQIASGLAKAHEKGIVHRDIKPSNIIVTEDGHAVIIDFGLAKLAGKTKLTKEGSTLGTAAYMSPEQARGMEVDHRSDIFSLGAVFYELLTGEPAFRGEHEAALLYEIVHEEPEPLESCVSGLPEGAQRVLDNALAKDRGQRYASAADLLADIKKLQEGSRVAALQRESRGKARRAAALYAVIGIVIVVAVYIVFSRFIAHRETKLGGESASISPTVVAVLPFTVRGGKEYADLGEGMVDLLSTKLDGAGALRSVDSHVLLSYIERTGGSPGPELGREIAGEFGAGLYILGDIMAAGRRLHINASLYESGGGVEPVAEATVEGEADKVTALVDDLASRLLVDRLGEDEEFFFDVGSITTESYPALKAYLEGEAKFRVSDLDAAIEAFQRAVNEDSTFALAWLRLSWAIWWPMTNQEEARSAVDQALRYSEGLPEHERLHIRALHAWLHDDSQEAEQLFRTIVGGYPDDFEAWQALSAVQMFHAPRLGQPFSVAREAAMRALSLNPNHRGSLFRLRTVAACERNFDELRDLIQRYPEHAPIEWRAALAFGTGDKDSLDIIMKELAALDDNSLSVCVAYVISYTDDLVRAADIVGLLTEPLKPDEVKGFGHVIMAHLEAARGRWRAAKTEFETAQKLNPAMAIEHHALLASLPFLPVSVSELEDIRKRLEEWKASEVPPSKGSVQFITIHDGVHQHLRIYLLGLLSVRLDDLERARWYTDELERLDGPPHVTVLAKRLAHGLRARMAWKDGNTADALDEFEQNTVGTPHRYRLFSSFYKDSFSRFMCAELLHELGRDEEALGRTVNFPIPWSYQCVYMAPVYKRRAEHFERTGQPGKAAEYYAKFVERWKNCDEELRPKVDEVRARLDALTAAQ